MVERPSQKPPAPPLTAHAAAPNLPALARLAGTLRRTRGPLEHIDRALTQAVRTPIRPHLSLHPTHQPPTSGTPNILRCGGLGERC